MGKRPRQFSALNKNGKSSGNPDRKPTGGSNMRSKSTIQRLNMYNDGRPKRNEKGKVVGGILMMRNEAGGKALPNAARIAPDRRWFGNTRTISQNELDKFRDDMSLKEADPYSVILRRKKIPMALLQESKKVKSINLLETETFEETFGSKGQRKRPKLGESQSSSYAALMANAADRNVEYDADPTRDTNVEHDGDGTMEGHKDDLFAKGQSKRIWGELYKVLDCSDVVLEIVDARNVPGTRCLHVERHIKKNASHKQLVIIINKCDLVPNWVTRRWLKILSADFPTVAFHAHMTKSFGKSALINLLRQFSKLHADKRQISVGVIGFPNVGKSSVINVLMGTKCCKAAPVPGETKVWQYIALTKRISLIDCPGIVYHNGEDSDVDTVLKGVVRAERLENPVDYIAPILSRVKVEYIQKQYELPGWKPNAITEDGFMQLTDGNDDGEGESGKGSTTAIVHRSAAQAAAFVEVIPSHITFLTQLAVKMGKLLKGNEADLRRVAVIVINDWQRGKLPYFTAPPRKEQDEESDEEDDEEADIAAGLLEDGKASSSSAADERDDVDEDDEDALQEGEEQDDESDEESS